MFDFSEYEGCLWDVGTRFRLKVWRVFRPFKIPSAPQARNFLADMKSVWSFFGSCLILADMKGVWGRLGICLDSVSLEGMKGL